MLMIVNLLIVFGMFLNILVGLIIAEAIKKQTKAIKHHQEEVYRVGKHFEWWFREINKTIKNEPEPDDYVSSESK